MIAGMGPSKAYCPESSTGNKKAPRAGKFEGAEETLALKVIARELLNHALRAATLRENEVQG